MPCDAIRAERSRQAKKLKKTVAELATELEGFTVVEPLTGANVSTQYVSVVGYDFSAQWAAEGHQDRDRSARAAPDAGVRWGLHEPLCSIPCRADQWSRGGGPLYFEDGGVRREVSGRRCHVARAAIRDFLRYRLRRASAGPATTGPDLVELVRQKLAMAGNEPADVSRPVWRCVTAAARRTVEACLARQGLRRVRPGASLPHRRPDGPRRPAEPPHPRGRAATHTLPKRRCCSQLRAGVSVV